MRRIFRSGLLVALCLFAASAFAQAPARIEFGQRVDATASAEGGDFYAFVALRGTRLKALLGLSGTTLGAVTLYDANGAELARAEGEGSAVLSHTLADDGIYLLGITSAVKGKSYVVALEGEEPEYAPVSVDEGAGPGAGAAQPVVMAAATPEAPAAFMADPAVWGIYALLAGRQSAAVPGAYHLAWVWTRPGEELVEEWRDGTGRVAHTNTLTRGGKPGELVQRASYLGNREWLGTVQPDGSVIFIGRGLIKMPFRASVTADDVFQVQTVKLSGGVVVSIDKANKRNRYPLAPVEQAQE